MITDKTIKKEIVRKAILKDYVETCIITGHCINDVLGMVLNQLKMNSNIQKIRYFYQKLFKLLLRVYFKFLLYQ